MDYHSAIKSNGIMPFATTWVDLEIIILSEVIRQRNNIAYIWNLKKNDMGKLICKIEIESQM